MMKSLGQTNKRKAILYSVVALSVLLGFLGVNQAQKVEFFYGYDESVIEYIVLFWVACSVIQFPAIVLGWVYNRFIQKDEDKKFVFFYNIGNRFSVLNAILICVVFLVITLLYSGGQEAHGRDFVEFATEFYYWEITISWVAPAYMAFFYLEGLLIFLWNKVREYIPRKI